MDFYQFQFAAGPALSSLTLLSLYLYVFVSEHVQVCVVCWCFSVMELCRISFLLFWAFQLVYAQQTTDPNEGSLSCLKIQKLVEVEYHLYLFKVFSKSNYTFCWSVDALKKIISHWNLSGKLNLTTDPCSQNASWAPQNANPRVACDCTGSTCHITTLLVLHYHF